jgi:predicted porin
MKKSLLALAALGAFAGTVSAQSSVTIYGVLDQSVAKNSCDTNCAINPGAPSAKAWTVQSSTQSRIGFRGNEDMGGGLSAQFQIEHRFNPDTASLPGVTGNASTAVPFWNGKSIVQLTSAAAGSVFFGRDYTSPFWIQLKADPFGNDGVGSSGVIPMYAGFVPPDPTNGAAATAVGAKASNMVGYKTPNLGGLTAQAIEALSETSGLGRDNSLNVEYTAGPIYAGFGYEKVSKGLKDGQGVLNLAAAYDLGVVRLGGYYARSMTGANGSVKGKVWQLSATAPLGSGLLKAAYYSVDPNDAVANDKVKKLGLGYNYNLSKRTNLYFDTGFAKADLKNNNNAYAFGLRHYF